MEKVYPMARVTTAIQWSSTRNLHQIIENLPKVQLCIFYHRFTDSEISRDRLCAHVLSKCIPGKCDIQIWLKGTTAKL